MRNSFSVCVFARYVSILLLVSACATDNATRIAGEHRFSDSVEQNLNATRPFEITASPVRNRVMREARAQLGRLYRYGGESPERGFDCSGLVAFTHRRAGIRVPRTSRGQLLASRKVGLEEIQPGDLVFFKIESNANHVGIYVGGKNFVHAPSSGKKVKADLLTLPYWFNRFVGAGNFYR